MVAKWVSRGGERARPDSRFRPDGDHDNNDDGASDICARLWLGPCDTRARY